jgi:hypothetical protein
MLSHLLRPARVRAAAAAVVFARLQTLAVRAHLIRITSHGHPDFMVIQVRVRPVRPHLVGIRRATDAQIPDADSGGRAKPRSLCL